MKDEEFFDALDQSLDGIHRETDNSQRHVCIDILTLFDSSTSAIQ